MISRCARISTVIILSRVDILRFLQRCHNEKNALKATKYDVYRIKFTKEGSYFFADQEGHYTFWM